MGKITTQSVTSVLQTIFVILYLQKHISVNNKKVMFISLVTMSTRTQSGESKWL